MPYRTYTYTLRDEDGYFINEVKSDDLIVKGDILAFKNQNLEVIEHYDNELHVKLVGAVKIVYK